MDTKGTGFFPIHQQRHLTRAFLLDIFTEKRIDPRYEFESGFQLRGHFLQLFGIIPNQPDVVHIFLITLGPSPTLLVLIGNPNTRLFWKGIEEFLYGFLRRQRRNSIGCKETGKAPIPFTVMHFIGL